MTTRGIITVSALLAIAGLLEMIFGTNDWGAVVALVLFVWGCTSIPFSLAFGKLVHDMREGSYNDRRK